MEKMPGFPKVVDFTKQKEKMEKENTKESHGNQKPEFTVTDSADKEGVSGKVYDLKSARIKQIIKKSFVLERGMQEIGTDHYNKLRNFVRKYGNDKINNVSLDYYIEKIKDYQDYSLFNVFKESDEQDWRDNPELYVADFRKLEKRLNSHLK